MVDIKILGDSSLDLTDELELELNAQRAVPFYLDIEGETLIDDENLSMPDFMAKMRASTTKMGSACPSPETWKDAFIKAGGGFAVTISGKLSAMYQVAKLGLDMAKTEASGLIGHVFDSKSASCGEVLIAMKIRQFIKNGLSFENVVKKVEQYIEDMKTFILLEDTSNLVKNGRMSPIKGAIVKTLGIKPILCANDGEIDVCSRVRGSAKIIDKLIDTVAGCNRELKGNDLVISHCDNPALANELGEKLQKKFGFGRVLIIKTKGLSSLYACDQGIIFSF